MRDIGILIWVALLIVGVVGSMTSRIRSLRQMRAQRTSAPQRTQTIQGAQPQQTWTTPTPVRQPFIVQAAQPVASPAKPAPGRSPAKPAPGRSPAPAAPRVGQDPGQAVPLGPHKAAKRLFGDRRDLVRAVIAAEVLGKPRAFGDEYLRNP